MSWAAVAGAAVGVVGGAMNARSARDAANTQAAAAGQAADAQLQASREANQLQAAALQQNLLTNAPGYRAGNVALSALMGGMGLGAVQVPRRMTGPSGDVPGPSAPTFTNAAGEVVDASGNVVRDNTYGIGSQYYGADQSELDQAAAQFQGQLTDQFTGQDLYMDPSYQFRLNEGQRALAARQAAGGNRFSGQALKDINNYAQDSASQEYGNAYGRFMQNRAVLYDRLSNLAGIGTGAGNAMTAATSGAANQIGSNTMAGAGAASNYLTGGAAASAAGQVGSTNALVSGVNSGLNNWYTMQYLRGNNRGAPGGTTGTFGATRGFDPYTSIPGYFGGDEGE